MPPGEGWNDDGLELIVIEFRWPTLVVNVESWSSVKIWLICVIYYVQLSKFLGTAAATKNKKENSVTAITPLLSILFHASITIIQRNSTRRSPTRSYH